jgi:hypothetical protein
MSNKNLQMILIGGIVGAAVAWLVWNMMKQSEKKSEKFMTADQLTHLNSIDTPLSPPDIPYPGTVPEQTLDEAYGPPVVGERYDALLSDAIRPMRGAALPQFNVDVANPDAWTAQVQNRISIKNPRWLEADPYRGDIPIVRTPNTCLIETSVYANRDSLRYQAMFSPYTNLERFHVPYMKNNTCGSTNNGTICDH